MSTARTHKPTHPEFERQVVEALKALLVLRSLSQSAAARLTGIAQPNLSVIIAGKRRVTWSGILDLMPIFGVDVDVVLRDAKSGKGELRLTLEVASSKPYPVDVIAQVDGNPPNIAAPV